MKVRLIGAGAVGAVVAAPLERTTDFALITDAEHYARYSNGIMINGNCHHFNCITPDKADIADLIIIAVKNFNLASAMDSIAPFVGPNTAILSLLNGVESEMTLSSRFGKEKVLYAFITNLSSVRNADEITCFSAKGGTIFFGEDNNEKTERVKAIEKLFIEAGVQYEIPEDIHRSQWWKFMLNCCYNTLSAILLTPYSKIYQNDAFIRASRMLCAEVVEVANAEHIKLDSEDVEKVITKMRTLNDEGKTSMLQDMEAGRRTENDYFCLTVVKLGRKHGIKTPIAAFLYQVLEAASHARA